MSRWGNSSPQTRLLKASYAVLLCVLVASCAQKTTGPKLGEAYQRVLRPEVWKVIPRSQAETLGLQPGDLVLVYDGVSVQTEEELRQAQLRAQEAGRQRVKLTILRNEEEIEKEAAPGPLGVVSVLEKYQASLALALYDILLHNGQEAEYDWLAALTGESFTFAFHPHRCRSAPYCQTDENYLKDALPLVGLGLQRLSGGDLFDVIKQELARGKTVIVWGEWMTSGQGQVWGVASRCDLAGTTIYGYAPGAAKEVALAGQPEEAFVVQVKGKQAEPGAILVMALKRALEVLQVHADTGWRTGIQAYDMLLASLDTVPFCPICGEDEVAECYERLLWTTLANRESISRFLEQMRMVLPNQAELLTEALATNEAIIGRLAGMLRSTTRPGKKQDQQKLARVWEYIQAKEVELVDIYEELITSLVSDNLAP